MVDLVHPDLVATIRDEYRSARTWFSIARTTTDVDGVPACRMARCAARWMGDHHAARARFLRRTSGLTANFTRLTAAQCDALHDADVRTRVFLLAPCGFYATQAERAIARAYDVCGGDTLSHWEAVSGLRFTVVASFRAAHPEN